MTYQVIARKWRPQSFEEVTGQEAITKTLRNAIEHERLHHAYIFSGSRGVGKTTTARLLAKALNCHKTELPNPNPCSFFSPDACVSCKEISESRSIDVFEFDAASHTGVDDIRELILESINVNPARDRYKVFIIDEVHMLSHSSFNALLKTLEEPPPRVEFIMATTELHKLPDTILSRCQEFEFRSISVQKIFDRLKQIAETEKIDVSDEGLREIARSGEGSMRDAQSNFDQVISFSGEKIGTEEVIKALGIASAEMLIRTLEAIGENNSAGILTIVDDLIRRGQDLRNFCRDLLAFFRDLLVVKLTGDPGNLLDTAIMETAQLRKIAEPFSEPDLIRFFNSLSETELKLHDALQPRYMLEIGLIKLVEMRRVTPIEELLKRIGKLETNAGGSPQSEPVSAQIETSKVKEDFPEKKTLRVEVSPDEIPFPVVKEEKENTFTKEETVRSDSFNSEFSSTTSETREEPPQPQQTSNFIEDFKANFVEKLPEHLSPIDSGELEHIEDNWLDSAYEKKLLLSGDDLGIIADASKIASRLIGVLGQNPISPAVEKPLPGNGTAFAPALEIPDLMPDFDEDLNEAPPFELPENPTEEEMYQFAQNHPLVKKALRIFRGKIIEIKRIEP
ncbi:MAG: DNA polymerase III subunit gamma/tau [Pyrinomonadaceae bacterium]